MAPSSESPQETSVKESKVELTSRLGSTVSGAAGLSRELFVVPEASKIRQEGAPGCSSEERASVPSTPVAEVNEEELPVTCNSVTETGACEPVQSTSGVGMCESVHTEGEASESENDVTGNDAAEMSDSTHATQSDREAGGSTHLERGSNEAETADSDEVAGPVVQNQHNGLTKPLTSAYFSVFRDKMNVWLSEGRVKSNRENIESVTETVTAVEKHFFYSSRGRSLNTTMVLVNSKKPAAGLSKLLMANRRDATRLFIYMENDGDDDDDDDDDGVDVAPAA
ncbi:hypothetical protein V6N11_023284 [Hibiscus sabdariffa]|uniref:Uncharacterized protein n=1 Tax=Hibiscus sabdariffa TaxID=183260 RepID=A0ABR2TLR2_9ROSI